LIHDDIAGDIELEKYEDIEISNLYETWKNKKIKLVKINFLKEDNESLTI
jgi:hypothetical protein